MVKLIVKRVFGKLKRLVILITIFVFCSNQAVTAGEDHYVLENNRRIPIPLTYKVVEVMEYFGEKGGFLNGAEDLFIDKNNYLYVADTLNNRVLKSTLDGITVMEVAGPPEKPLKNPRGIYVDDDGDMYIADTGNRRILHLHKDGSYIEEFVKPESDLLSEDFTFDPSKIFIDSTGYLYIIKSQSFFSMDAFNKFRGYVGATRLRFDFRRLLIRLFASDSQKARVEKELPASYSNFVIGANGMIYATVINTEENQIRKITSVGKNIYPAKFYGETVVVTAPAGMKTNLPNFTDIAVDNNGIVSVIEQLSGRIYQYDQEGNMLTAFGKIGMQKGMFKIPSSLVVDNQGRLYVLDQEANNIQVFEPTRFIKLVHEASRLYDDGRYVESRNIWEEVLKIDGKYSLAHRGIAKALFKEEKWKESMERYMLANDQEGYSQAFEQYRHSIYRSFFGWIVLLTAGVIIILFKILISLKKHTGSVLKKHMDW